MIDIFIFNPISTLNVCYAEGFFSVLLAGVTNALFPTAKPMSAQFSKIIVLWEVR